MRIHRKVKPVFRSDLPPEIAFLARAGFAPGLLAWALSRARTMHVEPARVLIDNGLISENAYCAGLARHLRLPFVRLPPSPGRDQRAETVLANGAYRAEIEGRAVTVLTIAQSGLLEALPFALSQGGVIITTPRAFAARVQADLGPAALARALRALPETFSARGKSTRLQHWVVIVGLVVTALAIAASAAGGAMLLPLLFAPLFLFSCIGVLAAMLEPAPVDDLFAPPHPADLPRYSLLVPLYRESAVVGQLVGALDDLAYPREKLEVLLLIEADDAETARALARMRLPPVFRVFVVPPGKPRTKPRALQAALPFITGEIVAVYDAEDRPDPNQLLAAASVFRAAPDDLACLQARIVIDNTEDGWLTRQFTIEYSGLFDVLKAGMARLGFPVPLGGTSNHFRADILRRVGGWDAWNVTEDADLGMRFARFGYRIGDLPSSTREEAPNTLGAWLNQRRRWLKGWMQTVATHTRRPHAAALEMGRLHALIALSTMTGTLAGVLGLPIFGLLLLIRLFGDAPLGSGSLLYRFADATMVLLALLGLVAAISPGILGLRRRRWRGLMPHLAGWPVYLALMSVAGWLALRDYLQNPYAWLKTMHGRARTSRGPIPARHGLSQKHRRAALTRASKKTLAP